MKTILISTVLLFSLITCFGQDSLLNNMWVDSYGNLFKIDDKQIINDGPKYSQSTYKYKISDSTLLMKQVTNWNDPRYKELKFRIKKLSNDSLVLNPLNRAAFTFSNNQPIELVDLQFIKDDSFVFEKLYFSSSTCYGKCPALTIVIESNREVKFISGKNTGIIKGNYKGFLTKKEYSKLIEILKKYPIEYLPSNYSIAIDGPVHHLIVWHNGIKKEVQGDIDSQLTQDLIIFLTQCHKNAILWPTFKKHNTQ